jgi:signal transduction histidine kinase
MDDKKMRKKYFSLKELRLSIAHMVLWSLLSIAFFTYLTIELGERIERGPLYIIAVISIYALVVLLLTLIFAHRFIGPFERLKMQLKIIIAGNYHKRLNIRKHDDIYVNSFIVEVNKLLDRLEPGKKG